MKLGVQLFGASGQVTPSWESSELLSVCGSFAKRRLCAWGRGRLAGYSEHREGCESILRFGNGNDRKCRSSGPLWQSGHREGVIPISVEPDWTRAMELTSLPYCWLHPVSGVLRLARERQF